MELERLGAADAFFFARYGGLIPRTEPEQLESYARTALGRYGRIADGPGVRRYLRGYVGVQWWLERVNAA